MDGDSGLRVTNEAKNLSDGVVDVKHDIEIVCLHCGFDLDESELEANTCSNCGKPLTLKRSMKIYATSVPAASGDSNL